MVLKQPKMTIIGSLLVAALAVVSAVLVDQADAAKPNGEIQRVVEVRGVEHKTDHTIRIFMGATERSGGVRYPITTIERNMVSVEFTNTSTAPAEAKSLSVVGNQSADQRRAMFVAFDLDRNMSARALREVRDRVSEIIADLPAQYLTVTAMSQGSARIIADVTPEKSDNINRIQQQMAALPPEGEGPALVDTLCVAAERFHAWNLTDFKRGDQKVLFIVSPPGDAPSTERFRAENCWRSLLEQKVRVYHVSFGKEARRSPFDLAAVAEESGGFVHVVGSPLDILAAVKNVIALLKNEYVLDVDAPDISLEDQPLELRVKVAYHDTVIASDVYNVGFVIPTLARVLGAKQTIVSDSDPSKDVNEGRESARKAIFVFSVVLIALALVGLYMGFRMFKGRVNTVSCNTCGMRVRKDHADCRFRKPDCIARFVFVSGPHAGMTIPLVRGPNRISSLSRRGVVLPRGGVSWFNHGTLVIDGFKAAYTPKKMDRDRINGWPVTETKLVGIGHVLKIGVHTLRFEIKPSMAGK